MAQSSFSISSKATDTDISSHFAILALNIVLLTLFSNLVYLKFKKNIFEHLILNIYNVSLWTILFVPISITLSLVLDNTEYWKEDILQTFFRLVREDEFSANDINIIDWNEVIERYSDDLIETHIHHHNE